MKSKMSKYSQSRRMAIIEALANVSSGMLIAFCISQLAVSYEGHIQYYIWSGFEWSISMGSNAVMTIILTVVSIIRGYTWRRLFNHHHIKQLRTKLEGEA